MTVQWKKARCGGCRGMGTVNTYTIGGTDYLGAGECPDCNGGVVYVTPTDRIAIYPGGPFRGRAPGLYATSEDLEETP